MHTPRSSFFLSLLVAFSFFFSCSLAHSAALPVLSETSKWRGQAVAKKPTAQSDKKIQQKATVSATTPFTVLGAANDISKLKKRVGPIVTASTTRKLERRISSRSVIIMDASSGKTLYSKNPNAPRQPASTIKILTGMIALKSLNLNEKVSVSRKAARQPRSKIYLDQQKTYKATDLINAVLLASANDASVALAEKIAGNETEFAKMMTLRAKLWGAKNTVCKTASGLTAKGQKSTARDLATIFRHAMEDPDFSSRMKRVKARTSGGKLLRNHNKALWQVKGTLGGKTGYTNAARQTYVGKFKRGNDAIVVAIMGSETMWADIKHLVEYGFKKKKDLARKMDNANIPVKLVAEL